MLHVHTAEDVPQVRDVISEGRSSVSAPHTAGLQLMSSGREIMPALGPSWASCVDVRIFLSRPGIKDAPAPPPSSANLVSPHSTVVTDDMRSSM